LYILVLQHLMTAVNMAMVVVVRFLQVFTKRVK